MRNDAEELLIALLRSEITGAELDKNVRNILSSGIPEELYSISSKHDLAHIVAAALSENKLLEDNIISNKFKTKAFMAVMRYELLIHEQERIYEVLEKRRIPYIPLKGAVIRELYPEPWLRTSCDIDILVHNRDLDKAINALVKDLECENKGRAYHDVSLITKPGVHLELHFNIKENLENIDRLLKKVWDYSSAAGEQVSMYKMNFSFLVFYIVAHMSYHFINGGCGIRPFIDLWFLKKSKEYNYAEIKELCAVCEIDTFFDAVLKLTEIWFDGCEYDELSEIMQEYIMYGGVYGTIDNSIAVSRSKSKGKIGYILKRIFPEKSVMLYYYPKLEKFPFLIPYYVVKRWFRVLNRDKGMQVLNELHTSKSLNDDKIANVSYLLGKLKL